MWVGKNGRQHECSAPYMQTANLPIFHCWLNTLFSLVVYSFESSNAGCILVSVPGAEDSAQRSAANGVIRFWSRYMQGADPTLSTPTRYTCRSQSFSILLHIYVFVLVFWARVRRPACSTLMYYYGARRRCLCAGFISISARLCLCYTIAPVSM